MPEPVSAGIMAGGTLVTGLLQARAQAEQDRRNRVLQAIQEEQRNKQEIQQNLAQNTQSAIGQAIGGFGQALS